MSITCRAEPPTSQLSQEFAIDSSITTSTADQYFRLYHDRLQQLRPMVISRAQSTWDGIRVLRKVLDCREVNMTEFESVENVPQDHFTVIIGTLYKEMQCKPSALDEYRDDRAVIEAKQQEERDRRNFTEESDSLLCEDEYGNVTVQPLPNAANRLDVHMCVTGVVMGLCGFLSNGIFHVFDFVLPDFISYSPSLPSKEDKEAFNRSYNGQYIAFVSDLQLGDSSLSADILLDFLGGYLGDASMAATDTSCISRIVFAGNTFPDSSNGASEPVNLKHLDGFMSVLASSVDVQVMPGSIDPSNTMLPQQPFHHCLFPNAATFKSFHAVTNPNTFDLEFPPANRYARITGSSGAIVQNMMMFSKLSALECLELSLRSHIIAPNAPDTLTCFPFKANESPLLIEKGDLPSVYFSGSPYVFHGAAEEGNAQFETKLVVAETESGEFPVRLMVLPSFKATGQIVLMKIGDWSCDVVQICVPS